ncbi:MAG: hypothetical protein ABFS23_02900 [Pseudomonadota bacterium]
MQQATSAALKVCGPGEGPKNPQFTVTRPLFDPLATAIWRNDFAVAIRPENPNHQATRCFFRSCKNTTQGRFVIFLQKRLAMKVPERYYVSSLQRQARQIFQS